MGLHYILQHLDLPGTHAKILFMPLARVSTPLCSNSSPSNSPRSTCQWITSFQTNRKQHLRLGEITSETRSLSIGYPQGCLLCPLLLFFYTSECTSKNSAIKLLKFAVLCSSITDTKQDRNRLQRSVRAAEQIITEDMHPGPRPLDTGTVSFHSPSPS